MSTRTFQDKVYVITGASSGIGEALARELVARGAHVVLAARRVERLDTLAEALRSSGRHVHRVPTDVTHDAQCKRLIDETLSTFQRIDGLILNAGISTNAPVQNLQVEVVKRVMDVDYLGAVQPFLHALPALMASRGQVIVISSLAGKKGLSTRAAYSGAKFALHGFFDAARSDLSDTGVHVMLACPGYVESEVRTKLLKGDGTEQGFDDQAGRTMQSAPDCARDILDAAARETRELVMGGLGPKILTLVQALAPGLADTLAERASGRKTLKASH